MPLTKQTPGKRLEWIYLVYLGFFVLAVMSPSLIKHSYFGLDEPHVEELLIFLFGLAGLGTFAAYERLMERRMKERDVAVQNAERATKELVESYRYIGSVNRQIELLKRLINQTSMNLVKTDAYWKDLLTSIAQNAASTANAKHVLIRFVELDKLRTEREVSHHVDRPKQLKMSNRELQKLHEFGSTHAYMRGEDGQEVLVVPSDRKDSRTKAYLLIAAEPQHVSELEVSLIKVFANQAELIYHHLMQKKGEGGTPLDQVDEVTSMSVGEVG